MSENLNGREIFKNLKNVIIGHRVQGEFSKDPDAISVAFSDLMYSVTSDKTETITFTILNLNLVLNPDGSVLLMEMEPGGVEIYEIENREMENELLQHLVWRMRILQKFEV